MADFFSEYGIMLLTETGATLAMTLISTLVAYVVGIPVGVLVTITNEHSVLPCRPVNIVLGWIVNMGRSIPFIILLVALMPFTRMIVGSAVGVRGVIVPLSIAAIPFVARMIETALAEIDGGLIEVAHATGSTTWQIIWKVLLPESIPSILMGVPITLITLVGYSAMAGTVGGGGLGDVALRYGYYRYQTEVMIATIIILIILVQIMQSLGSFIARKSDKRIRK